MRVSTARFLREWVRSAPVTTTYAGVILVGHVALDRVLPERDAARFVRFASTNLDNLTSHPVRSLLGSALVLDSPLTRVLTLDFVGTLITFAAGMVVVLGALERRLGAVRALAVFVVGHVGATLITALVIELALDLHRYPGSVRSARDVGISYGAQAVLACGAVLFARGRTRALCILFVLIWPVGGMSFVGGLPDFTTIGHWVAALLGFACGAYFRKTPSLPVTPRGGSVSAAAPR